MGRPIWLLMIRQAVVKETLNLLHNPPESLQLLQAHNPHGGGQATGRVVLTVLAVLGK